MAHEFGVRLALIGFATVAIRGLLAGAAFEPTLKLALLVLAAFYGLGLLCGELARRLVDESVQAAIQQAHTATTVPETTRR